MWVSQGLTDAISLQLAARERAAPRRARRVAGGRVSTELGKGELIAMELFIFVTGFSGAQGNLLLSCLAVSSAGTLFCSLACPGSVDVPAQRRLRGNGDAKQVAHQYRGCV